MNMTDNAPGQELLSLEDAADFLCVSKSTMYRLLDQGKLQGMKAGKQWRFRKKDLLDYMQRGPAAIALANLPMNVLDDELDFFAQELSSAGASTEDVDDQSLSGEIGKITQLIRRMVWLLHVRKGSDLHLERIWEDGTQSSTLRMRIDGVLHEVRRFPLALHEPLVMQWKQLAGIPIDVRSQPQDGSLQLVFGNTHQPLRLSVVPTIYGDKVAVRTLPTQIPTLDALGINANPLKKWLRNPMGLILITGPSGSGTMTTTVACARELTSPMVNIMSIQDPPEYLLPGVTQLKIEGFLRLEALRAVLFQDPDIILAGALDDDKELVQYAIKAAVTGHLVLANMRSFDVLTPLYQHHGSSLAESLVGVVNQRLLRLLCNKCKATVEPSADIFARVKTAAQAGCYHIPENSVFYGPKGCDQCNGTGYWGQVAVHEYFTFTPELKAAYLNHKQPADLIALAREQGFRSIFAEGVRRAVEGITSLEEVMRVIPV